MFHNFSTQKLPVFQENSITANVIKHVNTRPTRGLQQSETQRVHRTVCQLLLLLSTHYLQLECHASYSLLNSLVTYSTPQ